MNPINAGSWRNAVASKANNVFTYIFAAEMALKVVAMGFYFGDGTYLKDGWNKLDFIVVFTSLIAILPNVPNVSIFRSFRVLRPLRNLSALPGLRKLLGAFMEALPELMTVIFLLCFVFLIFSVLGLSLFMGNMDTVCRITPYPVLTSWEPGLNFTEYRCLNAPNVDLITEEFPTQASSPWYTPQDCYWPTDDNDQRPCALPGQPGNHQCYLSESYTTWCGSNWDALGNVRFKGETTLGMYGDYYFNQEHLMQWGSFNGGMDYGYTTFDNIYRAFVTVFESVTLENWSWIMYNFRDSSPPIIPAIFENLFAIIGSYVGLNLLLAVLSENFQITKEIEAEQQDDARKILGLDNDKNWAMRNVVVMKENSWLYKLATNRWFTNTVTLVILMNTIILATDHYPYTSEYSSNTERANFFCTTFFVIDMVLKLFALGIREYCQSGFNLFDSFVVFMSLIELLLSPPSFIVGTGKERKNKGLSAFRILRLLRLFKLAKQWKTMMNLIDYLSRTVYDMGYLMLLLCLYIFISGLIGQEFFANKFHFDDKGFRIRIEDPLWSNAWVPRANYNSLVWSLFNVFNIMGADNWNNIMYDGWRATERGYSAVYFMANVVLGQFLGMNMFSAILLSNFSIEDDSSRPPKVTQVGPNALEIKKQDTLVDLEALIRTIIEDPATAKQVENANSVFPLCRERTLFLFGPRNPLRALCANTVSHHYFDGFILLLIVISSACLVADDPMMDPNCSFSTNLQYFDMCLTACFTLEMLMKIVAVGFFLQPRAYLRSSWNLLDFIVVFVSLTSLTPSTKTSGNLKALKALRTLRAFRPLRMISRLPSLKKVVDTLFVALPGVGNVMAIAMFFLLVFGIICVNLFKGQMRNCALGALYTPGMLYDPVSNKPNGYGFLLTYPKSWNNLNATEKSWFGPDSPFNMSLIEGNCSAAWPVAPCCTAWPQDPDSVPTSRQICECWGSSWVVWWGYWTFDNIASALLALFQVSSTEGPFYLMLEWIDQNGIDMQPIRDNNYAMMFLIILFLVIVKFVAMNMVVGVIVENFQKQSLEEEFLVLTEQQQVFVKTHKIVSCLKPLRRHKAPKHRIRLTCFRLVEHTYFEMFIMGCILLNTFTMALQHKTQSDGFTLFLSVADYCFCCIFTTEAIVKLIALGKKYFSESWNRFDFVIVLATDVSLAITLSTNVSVGPIAQVVRSFRVGRVFRLINGAKSLNMLISTLMSTMIGLANVGALWMLIMFIFAVLGNQLYAKVALPSGYGAQLNYYYNFQTFTNSLITLFSFAGGEYWDGFSMALGTKTPGCVDDPPYDSAMCGFSATWGKNPENNCIPLNGCGKAHGIVFMCCFYFIVAIVMLNLFVGVILDEFSNQKPNDYLSKNDFANFNKKWSEFDPDATFFIDYQDLYEFLTEVSPPWRVDASLGKKSFFLKAVGWKLKIYKGNKVHFYDVIHALTKDIMTQRLHEEKKKDQNFEDAITKILKVHRLDEFERENVNGVQIGIIENYKVQAVQKAWKDHQTWKSQLRTSRKLSRVSRKYTKHMKVYPADIQADSVTCPRGRMLTDPSLEMQGLSSEKNPFARRQSDGNVSVMERSDGSLTVVELT